MKKIALLAPFVLALTTACGDSGDAERVKELEDKIEKLAEEKAEASTPAPNASQAPAQASSAASGSSSCNDGKSRNVRFINETGVQITNFYASPVGVQEWEEDILGEKIADEYDTFNINFDDGRCNCVYDFKANFSDGDEIVTQKQNICELGTFRYEAQ